MANLITEGKRGLETDKKCSDYVICERPLRKNMLHFSGKPATLSLGLARYGRVRPFYQIFGHNLALIDYSELSAMTPRFSKLNNVYLCI